jgi:hypothetical protein
MEEISKIQTNLDLERQKIPHMPFIKNIKKLINLTCWTFLEMSPLLCRLFVPSSAEILQSKCSFYQCCGSGFEFGMFLGLPDLLVRDTGLAPDPSIIKQK